MGSGLAVRLSIADEPPPIQTAAVGPGLIVIPAPVPRNSRRNPNGVVPEKSTAPPAITNLARSYLALLGAAASVPPLSVSVWIALPTMDAPAPIWHVPPA